MTREPCPGCPFAGCDRCEWQGGVSAGEGGFAGGLDSGRRGMIAGIEAPPHRANDRGLADWIGVDSMSISPPTPDVNSGGP